MTTSSIATPVTCQDHGTNLRDFTGARLGLFVHYGLYSMLGRGEWVLNREQIPIDEYKQLADRFDPVNFDADALVVLAREAGCRYVCLTTMHHDGFALYDSKVNPFNSVNACGRDLVAEVVAACRKHGLRAHLYHSLNHWTCTPDGAAALESKVDCDRFVSFTHERLRELATLFNPVECIWYDGWWPFHAAGWRSVEMNQMIRAIQPHILLNERNGAKGDFATPEQHLTIPRPWRPWEACITHNGCWSYHPGDIRFKPLWQVVEMLTRATAGGGNLLLNIGPDGSGVIPEASVRVLRDLGEWIRINGEAIYDSEPFTFDWQHRYAEDHGDWTSSGRYSVHGATLYYHLLQWPGTEITIGGIETGKALSARLLGSDTPLCVAQEGTRLKISGLPAQPPHLIGGVVAIQFDVPPSMYLCGGLRTPRVKHPRYDPCPSDLPPA